MKDFLKKIIVGIHAPRWLVLFIDIYIISNTFLLAYLIRFNFSLNFNTSALRVQLPLVILISLGIFLIVGSYKGIIKHTGVADAIKIFKASFFIVILLALGVYINRLVLSKELYNIPLSILLIHFLLNLVVLVSSRFIYKGLYYILNANYDFDHRILIYGAGDSGLITYSVIKKEIKSKVDIVAFLDDDYIKQGKNINGIPILNPAKLTQEFIDLKKIDEVIISIQKISSQDLMKIVEKLTLFNIKVKIVPPVSDWINNDLKIQQIKTIKIEDLLGRDPIKIHNPNLEDKFTNKIFLITGAAGSIGSEIAKHLVKYKYKQLILVDQAESDLYDLQQYFVNKNKINITAIVADVRNYNRMNLIFEQYQPNIIYHAAAYKHVPLMEGNPYEAVFVNIEGTKNIADLAISYKVEKFVMISTDKAVNPTNVMGATKRVAEMYINSCNNKGNTKFITTRFGNVLGSNGSVIPLFKEQIKYGGPLTVTHKEITRFFMTIPEACQLVLEASCMGNGGEIFVFDMGESVKIYDLALNMIRLSGLKYPEDIDIKIIGLRPGEKIYEEVLANGENTINTYHPKIKIAKIRPIDFKAIHNKIVNLCNTNAINNKEQIVLNIKEIVPEYKSKNSIFEVLDKPEKLNGKIKKKIKINEN